MSSVLSHSIESARSWWLALLVLLMASTSFGAVTAIPILLKPLMAEWQTGASSVAMVHTFTLVGGGLGSLVFGRLLDRYDFFPLALVGALATSGGVYLASQAVSLSALYWIGGVLLGAIGQGVLFSPLMVALSRWFDRNVAMAIAIASSGQSVGGLLVPPLLRQGEAWWGWRTSLALYAVAAALVLLPGACLFRRPPPARRTEPLGAAPWEAGFPRRRTRFWLYGAGFAVFNAITFAAVGHLLAFGEERGYAPLAAAALMSVLLGSTLVFRLASAVFIRRCGAYTVLLWVSALHVVGVLGLAWSGGYAGMALAAAAIGLGFGGYLPAYAILVRDMYPAQQAGRRVAEINCFGFIAAGLGSGLAGAWRDATGSYESTFMVCAVLGVCGLAGLWAGRRVLNPRVWAGALI